MLMPTLPTAGTPRAQPVQTIQQRRAILVAVDALLSFGDADAIADSLPRIELAKKLLKEIA